jgi:hypothetical protein
VGVFENRDDIDWGWAYIGFCRGSVGI